MLKMLMKKLYFRQEEIEALKIELLKAETRLENLQEGLSFYIEVVDSDSTYLRRLLMESYGKNKN